ncbi:hypothetical protein NDU88_002866 [Pleurodeles waltl]|uniref:Uncharacterized protein n=1 Tax=Pleurodeles waltl TaxID=8319 RepID=A0AAV7UWU5_PLEWA|nr:hypothetical protein NDU88_002866 [Pleurodeles waltl]
MKQKKATERNADLDIAVQQEEKEEKEERNTDEPEEKEERQAHTTEQEEAAKEWFEAEWWMPPETLLQPATGQLSGTGVGEPHIKVKNITN